MLRVFLCVVVLISTSNAGEKETRLEAPELVKVVPIDPEALYVEWRSVNQKESDPVLGYKIQIYEIPELSETELKLINAEEYPGYVKNEKPLQKFSPNNINSPTREVVIQADEDRTTIDKIKPNVLYEVRVVAFKKGFDGPPSEPIRIKVLKDTSYQVVIMRTVTGCQISVPQGYSNTSDESYPRIYNSNY